MIPIDERLSVPDSEIGYEFSRSGGPGGQHVNRVETKVTLTFDVAASQALDDGQKRRIHEGLATRINKRGVLRVVSQRFRTREANRRAAIERFAELLARVLAPRRPRIKTRLPGAAKRRRLEQKRHHGETKRRRGRVADEG